METLEKVEIRERIADSAFNLFCQKGIKSVTMDDIAQHLSMSKKTIYKWFTNKDEVVYASSDNYLKYVRSRCEDVEENSSNAMEELFKIMEVIREIFTKMHPSVFYDIQKYHSKAWQLWQNHKNEYILNNIKKNLARGVEEGLFRKDLDIEVISRLRLAQIELPFDQSLFPMQSFVIQQVQEKILEHFMLGVATLKGHKLINNYRQITEEE